MTRNGNYAPKNPKVLTGPLLKYSTDPFYYKKTSLAQLVWRYNIILMSSHSGDPIDVAN